MTGQYIIKTVGEGLNRDLSKLFKIDDYDWSFYSDTDSCYISLEPMVNKFYKNLSDEKLVNLIDKISKEKITPIINDNCLDLQTYTNSYRNMISFKQEGISSNGVWVAKKRYFLNVLDNEGVRYASPKLKVMGLEVVKSSTPGVVREKLKTCLSLILDNKEEDLQQFIDDFRSEFKSLPVEDIASPRGVNGIEKYSNSGYKDDDLNNFIEESEFEPNRTSIKKNPISNAGYNSGCPLHTKGAIIYNKKLKELKLDNVYPIVGEGDRIKYTYLKSPNPIKDIVISFPSELPKEFKLEKYIDYDKQFEKTFLEPIKSILQILDWTTEKTNSIEDFFS